MRQALLIMDIQDVTVKFLGEDLSLLNTIQKAIETARTNNIPVIYAVIGFRKGYPEANPRNKTFSTLKDRGQNFDTEKAAKVHASVAPQPDDIVVTKKRVSAFTGSDLEVVLRSLGIQHIILSGIATSGVVLSTLREAADRDYEITVLSDCCADRDEEVHRVLLTKIFPRQAEVITSKEWSANYNS